MADRGLLAGLDEDAARRARVDALQAKDKGLMDAQMNAPDPRLPFYMAQPPAMSPDDVALYRGAAYGTPHEAGITSPHEAAAYAYSLRSPALNYGLDFNPVKMVPETSADVPAGMHGIYYPDRQQGYAKPYPDKSPGSTLTHEMLHHSYAKIVQGLIDAGERHGIDADPNIFERALLSYDLPRGDLQHAVMGHEERGILPGRTAMTHNKMPRPEDPRDLDQTLGRVNDAVQWLREHRGEFKRMGPR